MNMDNKEIFEKALAKLDALENDALGNYRRTFDKIAGPGRFMNPTPVVDELLKAMAAAGLKRADLMRDLAALNKPPQPLVHLVAGMNFQPAGGGKYDKLFFDVLRRESFIDLSPYTIEPMANQTAADLQEMIRCVEDYNANLPGDSEAGKDMLRACGFPRGSRIDVGSAENVARRFRLWQLRLAIAEAKILKSRNSSLDLHEMVLTRLGLGGLIQPVLSGSAV